MFPCGATETSTVCSRSRAAPSELLEEPQRSQSFTDSGFSDLIISRFFKTEARAEVNTHSRHFGCLDPGKMPAPPPTTQACDWSVPKSEAAAIQTDLDLSRTLEALIGFGFFCSSQNSCRFRSFCSAVINENNVRIQMIQRKTNNGKERGE